MRLTKEDIHYSEQATKLAQLAKALSHPMRITILHELDKMSCCCTSHLTERFPLAQSTISQHLKALKQAGLIQGTLEPPKIKYCINKDNWQLAKAAFANFFK